MPYFWSIYLLIHQEKQQMICPNLQDPAPKRRHIWSSKLLSSASPSPNEHSHLGGEPADDMSLPHSINLPFKNINLFKIICLLAYLIWKSKRQTDIGRYFICWFILQMPTTVMFRSWTHNLIWVSQVSTGTQLLWGITYCLSVQTSESCKPKELRLKTMHFSLQD